MDEILKGLLAQMSVEEAASILKAAVDRKNVPNLSAEQVKAAISKKFSHLGKKTISVKEDGSLTNTVDLNIKAASAAEGPRTREHYRPTAKQLKKINAISLEDQSQDSGYVFEFQAADDKVDRGFEHFSKTALNEMAALAVKNRIPFLMASESGICGDHDWKVTNSKGFVFDAKEEDGNLVYFVYVADNANNKGTLEGIFSAQYQKLSVGFSLTYKDVTCDLCKLSIADEDCEHYPGMMDAKGKVCTITIEHVKDNYEISGVAVPAQPLAHVRPKSMEPIEGQMSLGVTTKAADLTWNGSLASLKSGVASDTPNVKDVGTINSVVNTIEDSATMADTQVDTEVKTESLPAEEAKAADAAPDDVQMTESCKSRVEGMIAKGVAPILESLEAIKALVSKEAPAPAEAAPASDEAQKAVAELKASFEAQVKALTEKLDSLEQTLKVAQTLPVPTVLQAIEAEKAEDPLDENLELVSSFGLQKGEQK